MRVPCPEERATISDGLGSKWQKGWREFLRLRTSRPPTRDRLDTRRGLEQPLRRWN